MDLILKIIFTTSHRPTPRTRSLLKDLVSVIPFSIRITRGKYTLEVLALQAVDIEADRIVILRNWKGNPRYLDIYLVNPVPRTVKKICTLTLCGYSLVRECKHRIPVQKPLFLAIPINTIVDKPIPDDMVECLVQGLKVRIEDVSKLCTLYRDKVLLLDIALKSSRKGKVFELQFKDCKGERYGPVLRVCKARIFIEPL